MEWSRSKILCKQNAATMDEIITTTTVADEVVNVLVCMRGGYLEKNEEIDTRLRRDPMIITNNGNR